MPALVRAACAASAAALLAACPAVYPELKTPMRPVAMGQALDPPPPSEVRWLAFKGARIPERTRDGRLWGNDLTKGLPDPYAKLMVSGVEVLRTKVQRSTLAPSWADSPKGNFRVRPDDKMRVEIWDARVINDHPIGLKDLGPLSTSDQRGLEEIQEECESGAQFSLANEPAHGFIGYGLSYELRTYEAFITRVFEESPASRAGLKPGDQLISIDGREVRAMKDGELQSLFNAPSIKGHQMAVRHEDGSTATVDIKEGAVYPLFREIGAFE